MKIYKVRSCPSCQKHTRSYRRTCIGCGARLNREPSRVESPDWAVTPKGYRVGSAAFMLLGAIVGGPIVGFFLAVVVMVLAGLATGGSFGAFWLILAIARLVWPIVAIVAATVSAWLGYVLAVEYWYRTAPEATNAGGQHPVTESRPAGQGLADFYQTRAED